MFNGNPSPWGRQCSTGSNSSWWIWTPPFWPGKVTINLSESWQTEVSQAATDLHWWSPSNWHPQQPSLSKGPRGYWHALSRTDDSLDPWKQPSQSSSKPHINKDLCHLKQPYLSTCEKVWSWTLWTHRNFHQYFEHPYKHSTEKHHNIPMQQGFCEPCGQICEENIQQLHNEGVNHLHRIPLSATWHLPFTQTKTSLPGRTGGHHSCGTRGGGPSRRTPWRTVKSTKPLRVKKGGRKRISIGIGHGTHGERSLKEASDFVAHVLQLSIKPRSHDDWIAKEHLPNSLTPRIVPGCLWHHDTVKLALMTFTWGTRPIHSAGHWIHTVDLQFLHIARGPGTQGQLQLGAGCHTP